uniref:Uncharacterized protein n=1 Tax=Tetradesmus obliquus TaxID=3088 RepID=A0A383WMF2_TETOB|eukprot:jgi/Sobl393_1/18319/SZX77916.1
MAAADMARGFWASEKLGYRWLPPQLAEFDRQAALKLSDMAGPDVALLLAGYKAHGHAPSVEWLQRFAEMPAASLAQLSCDEALQLAVQLADGAVGLPASRITWLPDWAGSLSAQQLQGMTGQQVFSVLRLLDDASTGSTGQQVPGSTGSTRPKDDVLALLCWAVLPHVTTASADDVYCLARALGSWRYVPPNGDVLLAATATRLAEKLPVLSQQQAVDVLCAFANLGCSIGEPLLSKLTDKVSQAAAAQSSSMDAAATAELLGAVLLALPNPKPRLVTGLMQQMSGKLPLLAPQRLLQLGQAMATAGVGLPNATTPAAAAAAVILPAELAQQYAAAAAQAARKADLMQLAAQCAVLQQLGLMADASIAEQVVQALQPLLSAAVSGTVSSSSRSQSAAAVDVAAVARYITDSGFRPTAEVMSGIEQLLLLVLREATDAHGSNSSSTDEEFDSEAASQQQQQQLGVATLAQLLLVLNRWGRRPGGSFSTAVFDWSRYQLASADVASLGPLLLGVTSVCGRPPAVWVLDWSAVALEQLDQASADDLTAVAAGIAELGSTSDLCSSSWLQQYSEAVRSSLTKLTEQQLESIAYALYRLRFAPSREWVAVVVADLQRRLPATDTPAARALAYIQQLKCG